MTTDADRPFTLAFIGHADPSEADRASAYEDRVLALLADHGADLVYRGRRTPGQADGLPLEVHLIRFPGRAAFDRYLADERRLELRRQFGEVFTSTQVVELDTLVAEAPPGLR
jgi:hypothetical protein